jgi:hypothetical protein
MKCLPSIYPTEDLKELRRRITKVHKPETNIKFKIDPERILLRRAMQLLMQLMQAQTDAEI